MKKAFGILFLTTIVLGLVACSRAAENQDTSPQTTVAEQRVGEVSSRNVDTYVSPSTNEQDLTQEQLVGMVKSIDEISITITTIQAMIFNNPEVSQHIISPGTAENEPHEPQQIIIQLTEQTVIEVNEMRIIAGGGQMANVRAGTIEDLTLQAIVMATGEWQGDDFIVASLRIMPQ